MDKVIRSIVLILFFSLQVSGSIETTLGQCEEFDLFPQHCSGIMVDSWSSIWTSPSLGFTQEYFVAQMSLNLDPSLSSALDITYLLPAHCAALYLRNICPLHLRPCVYQNETSTVEITPICRSVCEEFINSCGIYIDLYDIPLNCSMIDPLTGSSFFSDINCSGPTTELSNISYPCPPPTQFNSDVSAPLKDRACQLPCLLQAELVFADTDTIHAMFITWSVISWISMVLVSFTVGIYLSIPLGRTWPHRITIFLGIAHLGCHLVGVVGSFFSLEELLCKSTFEFQYHGMPKFQAWAIFFGSLSTSCWWLILSITIFWNVALLWQKRKTLEKLEPLFHLFCWGYPMFVAFLLTWTPSYLASGGGPSGFPWGGPTQFSSTGLLWGFYIDIYCLFLLFNMICVGGALWRIMLTPKVREHGASASQRGPAQLLVISFLIVFLNLVVAFIAVSSYKTANMSNLEESLSNYHECLLSTHDQQDGCHRTFTYEPFFFWYDIVTWGTFGIPFAIIFLGLKFQLRQHISERIRSSLWTTKQSTADSTQKTQSNGLP